MSPSVFACGSVETKLVEGYCEPFGGPKYLDADGLFGRDYELVSLANRSLGDYLAKSTPGARFRVSVSVDELPAQPKPIVLHLTAAAMLDVESIAEVQ